MAETDFFSQTQGRYQGSRYPGFVGGSTTGGNIAAVPRVSNIGSAIGQNLTAEQVRERELASGDVEARSKLSGQSIPQGKMSFGAGEGTSFAGELGGSVLPAIGREAGAAIGGALEGGASFGSALGEGLSAAGDVIEGGLSGDIGSLLGMGSSTATTGTSALSNAPMTAISESGAPMSTTAALQAGESATTTGVGSSFGATAGAAGLMGVGSFLSGLLSGQDVGTAAIGGAASAAGGALGSVGAAAAFGSAAGPVGMVIGGILGGIVPSLFGGGTPHPGGQSMIQHDPETGRLVRGNTASKHIDNQQLIDYSQSSVDQINKILDEQNLQIVMPEGSSYVPGDTRAITSLGAGQYYEGPNRSTQDLWNYLIENNWIQSKTPETTPTTLPAVVRSSADNPQLTQVG